MAHTYHMGYMWVLVRMPYMGFIFPLARIHFMEYNKSMARTMPMVYIGNMAHDTTKFLFNMYTPFFSSNTNISIALGDIFNNSINLSLGISTSP